MTNNCVLPLCGEGCSSWTPRACLAGRLLGNGTTQSLPLHLEPIFKWCILGRMDLLTRAWSLTAYIDWLYLQPCFRLPWRQPLCRAWAELFQCFQHVVSVVILSIWAHVPSLPVSTTWRDCVGAKCWSCGPAPGSAFVNGLWFRPCRVLGAIFPALAALNLWQDYLASPRLSATSEPAFRFGLMGVVVATASVRLPLWGEFGGMLDNSLRAFTERIEHLRFFL